MTPPEPADPQAPLLAADLPDPDFERREFPLAGPEIQGWMRESRAAIRWFLASDHGRLTPRHARVTSPPQQQPGSRK